MKSGRRAEGGPTGRGDGRVTPPGGSGRARAEPAVAGKGTEEDEAMAGGGSPLDDEGCAAGGGAASEDGASRALADVARARAVQRKPAAEPTTASSSSALSTQR